MRSHRQLREAPAFWRHPTATAVWKLEDAKARFSEVVRRARSEGPQRVTLRGKEAVVIISSEEYERMQPGEDSVPLVDYLESLYVEGLDLTREPDRGRDIDL
jgi:antitoxin Phd